MPLVSLQADPERAQQAVALAEQAAQLLADRYGARQVYLFGSALTLKRFHAGSDVDLAAEGLPAACSFAACAAVERPIGSEVRCDLVPLEDVTAV
jgi:predicted nucleotidyltransferase